MSEDAGILDKQRKGGCPLGLANGLTGIRDSWSPLGQAAGF